MHWTNLLQTQREKEEFQRKIDEIKWEYRLPKYDSIFAKKPKSYSLLDSNNFPTFLMEKPSDDLLNRITGTPIQSPLQYSIPQPKLLSPIRNDGLKRPKDDFETSFLEVKSKQTEIGRFMAIIDVIEKKNISPTGTQLVFLLELLNMEVNRVDVINSLVRNDRHRWIYAVEIKDILKCFEMEINKLRVLKMLFANPNSLLYMNCKDVMAILDLFGMEMNKLDALQILSPCIMDKQNLNLFSEFYFSNKSSKEKAKLILRN